MIAINFDYIKEQVKDNINIMDIVEESDLQLRKRGRNFIGLCPFHTERTPSFSVSPEKQIYKCFGCDVGGDAINLYARLNGISNGKAIGKLARKLGIPINGKPVPVEIKREYAKKKHEKNVEKNFLVEFNQLFLELCDTRQTMNELIRQYDSIYTLQLDELVVEYYHLQVEYLLDQFLKAFREEISFQEQINTFVETERVVEKWKKLYLKRCEIIKRYQNGTT